MNSTSLKGDWTGIKEKLRQKWPALTDEDLVYEGGSAEELIGRIAQRTGANREDVEAELWEIETAE